MEVHTQAEQLGARLRAARDSRHLSQKELAEALSVSERALQDYEHGLAWPRPKTRRRILAWLLEVEA